MRLRIAAIVVCTLAAGDLTAQSAVFGGVVRNGRGATLADMTVQAYNPLGIPATATTDSQGRYVIIVPAGTYRLVAYDNSGSYAVTFHENAPSFEQSQPINVTPGQQLGINFTLPDGLAIRGAVGSAVSGAPIRGAVVAAYNLDGSRRTYVTTSADGTYTLTVPAGAYKLVAFHESDPYIPVFYRDQAFFDGALTITAPASNINFALTQGVKIRGTVLESVIGVPLAGLSVVAYDNQGVARFRTETNPQGDFAFVLPASRPFKFAVEDEGHVYQTTFYRDATTFESAATIVTDASAPFLRFSIGKNRAEDPRTTIYIPGVIYSQNAGTGTFFKTDVWIQNSNPEPITVDVVFLPAGQDNSNVTGIPATLPANGQIVLEEIVRTVFGTTGAGALRLESRSRFRATSRTYNEPPNAAQIGTFGLSIPGQNVGATLSRATLTGLVQNADSRTNIGLMNPHPFEIEVQIEVFSQTGVSLGTFDITLRPGEWAQPNVASFVGPQFDHAYAIVTSEAGSFFSYAAVIDAKSGDGTFILPAAD